MTIEEERFVDFIGFSRKYGTQILTISDHLTWRDYEHHSMLLQSKINYYLEYIYSSMTDGAANEHAMKNISIQLIMKHEPTMQATALLHEIEKSLKGLGFEFVYSVFNEDPAPDKEP